MIYITLLTCIKMGFTCFSDSFSDSVEVESDLERKQFPQAGRLMMVFDVDIIISEPIQTACTSLKLFCVLYSFLHDLSFRYVQTLRVRR